MGFPVSQCAHYRKGHTGGMGLKPPDDRTLPLCPYHHNLQGNIGENAFWTRAGLDPEELLEKFA